MIMDAIIIDITIIITLPPTLHRVGFWFDNLNLCLDLGGIKYVFGSVWPYLIIGAPFANELIMAWIYKYING